MLDLACGTGAMSVVAARAGAQVTGIDISADQLAKARRAAEEAGLEIAFDEGDVQALPYAEGSFDLAGSAFGLVFAVDHARTAGELTRVLRTGGRLAFTAWTHDEWSELGTELGRSYPGGDDARDWSLPEYVETLLGGAVELERQTGEWTIEADSSEDLWELLSTSAPPLRTWLAGLDADTHARARRAYLDFLAGGTLRREYVLWLGRRR
jgi:ubiquinone/menaquinone biosynthesis C-methylase UbiE